MGIFGGGGDAADNVSDMMAEQTRQTQAETQRKIESLKKQRLALLRSQGVQNWTSENPINNQTNTMGMQPPGGAA